MKTSLITAAIAIAAIAITQALTSCAGLTLTATTPWGDVSTTNGATTVALRPIVISGK